MKVRDLIGRLIALDPDLDIVVLSSKAGVFRPLTAMQVMPVKSADLQRETEVIALRAVS